MRSGMEDQIARIIIEALKSVNGVSLVERWTPLGKAVPRDLIRVTTKDGVKVKFAICWGQDDHLDQTTKLIENDRTEGAEAQMVQTIIEGLSYADGICLVERYTQGIGPLPCVLVRVASDDRNETMFAISWVAHGDEDEAYVFDYGFPALPRVNRAGRRPLL